MGYCPQHDPLFENITMREHIETIGMIKGIHPDDAKNVAQQWVPLKGFGYLFKMSIDLVQCKSVDIVVFVLQKLHRPFNRKGFCERDMKDELWVRCLVWICTENQIASLITPLLSILPFHWFRACHMICLSFTRRRPSDSASFAMW